jgi:alpha-D-ribose 1-methylphosphonate 5-phosphate C-P lyase
MPNAIQRAYGTGREQKIVHIPPQISSRWLRKLGYDVRQYRGICAKYLSLHQIAQRQYCTKNIPH